MDEKTKERFPTEGALKRKFTAYLKFCNREHALRLPNPAGFCRYCQMSRDEFAAQAKRFPVTYDVIQSAFIDEALNRKVPNAAATMSFLLSACEQRSERQDSLQLICAHDPYEDGA